MAEYIERGAAESECFTLACEYDNYRLYGLADAARVCGNRIQKLPAADVRPVVRGEWKERRFSEDVYDAECSVCHTTWDYGTNFCPYCGADMRETKHEPVE